MGKCSVHPKAYQKIDQSPVKEQMRGRQHWPKSNQAGDPSTPQARVLSSSQQHACQRHPRPKDERLGTTMGTWAQGPATAVPSTRLSQPAPGCMSVPPPPAPGLLSYSLGLCHTPQVLPSPAFFSPRHWPAFLLYHSIPKLVCAAQ